MEIENLQQLEKDSIARGIPIIGASKGKWLLEKIQKVKPAKVLELGTANGYSGCILGSEGAEVITIELNQKITTEAVQNFKEHNINAFVIIGDGVEIVKEMVSDKKQFDMIFIDFYKKGYMKVLEDCISLVKIGGWIIADNITFDECQDFKEAVLRDSRLQTDIIDIKDGLSYSEKV
jgi:predicted O-methyltransferase YrrM